MSRTLKWIIGIVIAVVVIAAVVLVGFWAFTHFVGIGRVVAINRGFPMPNYGPNYGPNNGPRLPYRNMPMMPYYGYPGSRLGGLLPLGISLFGFLVIVGLIALVLILLFRRPATAAYTPAATGPVEETTTAPSSAAPAATTAPATHPCPNCGRVVQDDWNVCPYCSTQLHS